MPSSKPLCKKGYIIRKSYIRKTPSGKIVKVKANCIKSRSILGVKRSVINKIVEKAISRSEKYAARKTKKRSSKRCPKGMILRSAYIRKSYVKKDGTHVKKTVVPAECIPAKGLSIKRGTKGKKLIGPMISGALGQFGYHADLPIEERHKALKKAIKKYSALSVGKKLNAVYVLNRNTNPKIAKILKKDSIWAYAKHQKVSK